jgi:hypothetical protein
MSNISSDINGKMNLILSNSFNSQSTNLHEYQNLLTSNITHPFSTLKQINQILLDQQSNLTNKYVSYLLINKFEKIVDIIDIE